MKMKLNLNALRVTLCVGLAALLATSCGKGKLMTESDVKNAVKELMEPHEKYFAPTAIQTGFYELNSEGARTALRKLAAAGMITYDAQIVIEKVYNYYYRGEKEHVFVSVALTPEGEKYVMSEADVEQYKEALEEAKKGASKDLECPNADTEYPEASVGEEVITKIVRDDPPATAESAPVQNNAPAKESAPAAENTGNSDNKPAADLTVYEKALQQVSTQTVYVKAYKMQVNKVRHVRCTPAMFEEGEGEAEIIIEYCDVTPFGRILEDVLDGEKMVDRCKFIYYNDLGWIMVDKR